MTREGRFETLRLLPAADQPAVRGHQEGTGDGGPLGAVSKARFEPARVAGLPVAVNMVWMVAHTTVRGRSNGPIEIRTAPVAKKRVAARLAVPRHARA